MYHVSAFSGLNRDAFISCVLKLRKNSHVVSKNLWELLPVVDSVVSQFTTTKFIYKIISY